MTIRSHRHHVDSQFGQQAEAYLTSQVHASGRDLERLRSRLAGCTDARLLDIGCGAGHASFIAAEQVAQVTAYDLSQQMLEVVSQTAQARVLDNLATRQGVAEHLPFEDNSLDIVISRYSAHHWQDPGMAMREVRRVLTPGGRAIFMDIMSPGPAVTDIFLQTIEALRDTSHVRNYSSAQWLEMFIQAGLAVQEVITDRLMLEFSSWVTRMRTPTVMVEAIRAYQQSASDEVKRYFALQEDGSFSPDTIMIEAIKPG
ncbi:class I SAM-dependent methyltransferase [Siccibacter turicensis]|uniref:class I SAM-dependent methyltransferase n=1 Tax=Siccibacter turicensis TaxID=357233 RepID=UPI0023F4EC79|nr:class I SAM-dependent methyltransferase [Siccibacter turicensis]